MDTNPTAVTWAAIIREAREREGLSRTELAARVNVSTSMVGFWETGKHAPSSAKQGLLMDVLDIDPAVVVEAIRAGAA